MNNFKAKGCILTSIGLLALIGPMIKSCADDVSVPNMDTSLLIPQSYVVTNGQKSLDNVLNKVSDNIDVDSVDQSIQLSEPNQLVKDFSQVDIDNINALSASQGLPANLTKESVVQTIDNQINKLNKQIQEGQLEVQDDGQLIDTSDSDFYVQGGSTKDITYWWGRARYKSTANANKWAARLNGLAAGNTATAVVAGVVLGGVGAVPNGLTAAYSWGLPNSISYHNSLNNRGIVANITWVFAYSIHSQ